MADSSSYKNIFKSTFLFGFVQIFNIIVKVVLNKFVALLLGPEGMGVIGIYHTVVNMIKTGAGLGISQSAVRDISEANTQQDKSRFSKIISLTNYVILFTSVLGIIVTIVLAPQLSKWYFADSSHTLAFVWISLVVGLNILTDGQLAILKGMRQLRALAKASMYGSIVGLITGVPCYYLWGQGGIIPSLLVSTFSSLLFSNHFVRKVKYDLVKFKFKEAVAGARPMVKMGVALMLVGFFGYIFDMVIAAYISRSGSLADVGYFNAGAAIITSYFGIVITAMSTDYYPRISAVHNDNSKLTDEMNKQSETGLVLIFPLVVLFVFLSPYFIQVLYSSDFGPTNDYTDYAMLGTVIIVVSNTMGMILLAKQASNIFVISVLSQKILLIGIYILGYTTFGLMGLGFSYIGTGLVHLIFMTFILRHFFSIRLSGKNYSLLVFILIITVFTIFARKIDNMIIRFIIGAVLCAFSGIFTYFYMKKVMDINILTLVANRFKKHK